MGCQLRNSILVQTVLFQNLSRLLTRFNLTVGNIQNILELHQGTVLSGSTILQAYMGTVYKKYDLDFYIPLRTETYNFLRGCVNVKIDRNREYLIRSVSTVVEYFGLPSGKYTSARLMVSQYFPEHFGFVLELIQEAEYISRSGRTKHRLNKVQFIFVHMDKYSYPMEVSCDFVVDYFDLSIVQNYYNGKCFCARHIKHILEKQMTLNTRYSGAEEVSEVQMERLLKYAVKRGIKFLGPYLPLSTEAKDIYRRYVKAQRRTGAQILFPYKVLPKPPFSEAIISGSWIETAVETDAMFYDSDEDDMDKFRAYWRRQRRLAMHCRSMGCPDYKNEARIHDLMPKKYALHRRLVQTPASAEDVCNGEEFS